MPVVMCFGLAYISSRSVWRSTVPINQRTDEHASRSTAINISGTLKMLIVGLVFIIAFTGAHAVLCGSVDSSRVFAKGGEGRNFA